MEPAVRVDQPDDRPDLGPPTTLVLVRHGRTDDTDERRVRGGSSAGPQLNAAGQAQVADLAQAFRSGSWEPADAGDRPRGPRPVVLVASPLLRARQTATAVAAALDLEPRFDPAWAELDLGDWDGLSYAEIAAGWPERYGAWRASSAVAPPSGESLDELAARAAGACDRLVREQPGRTVLVVSHTAPIRSVIARALDAGPAALWRLRVDPARLSVIRFWADGGCEVATVNSPGPP